MERFDIAVIGTGPAGLEAAITAKIRNKNVLLIGGKNSSVKVEKAHTVNNYLGLPAVSGTDMKKAFLDHLTSMGLDITEDRIDTVYAMGDFFALQGHKEMYEAKTVIIATGVAATKEFPGELENLGMGVSYCATCDAMMYRGKSAIVIGYSKEEEKEAEFLSEVADKVIYIPMYEGYSELNGKVEVMSAVTPVSIEKTATGIKLNLKDSDIEANGLFILREVVGMTHLVPGLELRDNFIETDRKMQTNIPGLFACGDITGAPFQYIKAAGEGNVAALSAVNYLMDKKL